MKTDDFQSLVHKHLDDAMSPRERDVLEQRLLASPEARAEFWRIARQHAALSAWGESQESASYFKPMPASRPRVWWAVGALALVALAVCAGVAEYIRRFEMAHHASAGQVAVGEAHPADGERQPDNASPTPGGASAGTVVVQASDAAKGHRTGADDSAKGAATTRASEPSRTTTNAGQPGSDGSSQTSASDAAKREESQRRLQDAMSHVSPEGQKILDQIRSPLGPPLPPELLSAELRVPKPGNDKGAAGSAPLASGSQRTGPQPLNAGAPVPTKQSLSGAVVDAGNGFFDSKTGFGVFVDDVVLDHPNFHLTADQLEIYMLPEDPAKGALPGKNGVGGNLKTAIAKGRKIIITKQTANGEVETGCGREAVYDGVTGDMLLRGWPQMQKGNNLTVATEPATYFIIKADGRFVAAGGRAQTRIVQASDK